MAHPDMRHISFTYSPMTAMWVVALHSLFLYSDLPLPCHLPSIWLRLFLNQNFSHINTPTPLILHTYLPMKMEQTVFRNVGIQNSDAGELPRRKHTTFRTQWIVSMLAYVYYLTNYLSFQIALYSTLLAEIHTSLLDLQRGINFLSLCHLS